MATSHIELLDDADRTLRKRFDERLTTILATEGVEGALARLEDDDPLLVTAEAAKVLRTTPRALEAHRYRGSGPKFIKMGQRVLYRKSDLLRYLSENTVQSTSENTTAQ